MGHNIVPALNQELLKNLSLACVTVTTTSLSAASSGLSHILISPFTKLAISRENALAALPSTSTEKSLEVISATFPVPLVKAPNVIAIGLYNTNMILHCPTMVMNAGRIETSNGNFSFYKDGMSPSVCKVMEEMDRERIAVGKALGIELLSTEDDMKQIYGLEGTSLREVILNNPVYCDHGMDAPKKLLHRYLEEDVPFLLVPVYSMADKLGIPTPAINNIIYLAGVINGTDYFRRGPGIEDLGFRELNIDEMIKRVNG